MDFYKNHIPIFDDGTNADVFAFGATGYDPNQVVPEMFAPPSEMGLIPVSEWDARYEMQEETKSSLEHVYLPDPNGEPVFINLDQNGHGYCWSYSVVHSLMICRIRDNLPFVRLNPHSVAAIIKAGKDEGGWCGLSAKFIAQYGCAPEGNGPNEWPLHSRNTQLDTPALRAAMLFHRSGEEWRNLQKDVWDQKLNTQQYATALLLNQPCASDFNHWGHSVCAIRWVRIEAGSWGPLILNSWKGWGRHGLAVLRGSKGKPDGAITIRNTRGA